jgi:hypothetical protein
MGRRVGRAAWTPKHLLLPILLAASILSLRIAPPNLPTFASGNHRVTVQRAGTYSPCFDQDGQEIAVLPHTAGIFVPRLTSSVTVPSREHPVAEIETSCYNRPPPTV